MTLRESKFNHIAPRNYSERYGLEQVSQTESPKNCENRLVAHGRRQSTLRS